MLYEAAEQQAATFEGSNIYLVVVNVIVASYKSAIGDGLRRKGGLLANY